MVAQQLKNVGNVYRLNDDCSPEQRRTVYFPDVTQKLSGNMQFMQLVYLLLSSLNNLMVLT